MEHCLPMSDLPRDHEATADPDDRDDRRLLAAFVERDDRDALGRLLGRHAGIMLRVARRVGGNAADAEDAVQEACLDAMRAARSFRGEGSVRGWLLAAVHNRCRMRARAERRRRRREAIQASPPSQPPPEDLVAAAQAALARLPAHERVAIELRCIDGLAHAEIASATGRREATVRKQVERGLARLRGLLDRAGYAVGAGAIATALIAQAPPATPSTALAGAVAKAVSTGPAAAAIAGSITLATGLAGSLALAALAGAGWWAVVPRSLAVAQEAEPAPPVAPAADVLARPVTVRMPRASIAVVVDVLQQQAGFRAVIPPPPLRVVPVVPGRRRVIRASVIPENRVAGYAASDPIADAALQVEGLPLRAALDRLGASGWSWARIAGRVCLWRRMDPERRADAVRRLHAADRPAAERDVAAIDLLADHDPDALRDVLAAVAGGGEPGAAVRRVIAWHPTALLVLAEDAAAQRLVSDALARAPLDPFWLGAAGQVRASAELDRLRRALADAIPAEAASEPGQAGSDAIERVAQAASALGWIGDRPSRPALERLARSAHDRVRIAALDAVAELGDPASLPLLLELLPSTDSFARGPVIHALVACAPPAEQPAVVRAILAQPEGGPANAYRACDRGESLEGITDPAAWRECVAVLGDPQREAMTRALAGSALGAASDRPDIREALLAALEDRHSPPAGGAAWALSIHADEALVERLTQRLAAGAGDHDTRAWSLPRALGLCRLPSAAEALLRLAPNGGYWTGDYLRMAVHTGQPFVAERVRGLLDPRWPAPLRAAAAAVAVGDVPERTARLIETLLADDAPEVRVAAVARLREPVPHLDRIAALATAVKDPAYLVRANAATILGESELTDLAFAPLILPLTRDPEAYVRWQVADLLPLALDDDAVWTAAERLALDDDDPKVRLAVIQGPLPLDREHPRLVQAIELLSRMLDDPDDRVRRTAKELLDRMASIAPPAVERAERSRDDPTPRPRSNN